MENKLTPYDIAEDVVRIEITEEDYKDALQVRFDKITPLNAITWSQTQTFGTGGVPKDKDND